MVNLHGGKADSSKSSPSERSRARFIASTGAAFSSIALIQSPVRAAEFDFKVAGNQPVEHPLTVRMTQMWEAIKKESGGRINAKVYPNSMLGSDPSMFSQLRLGAIHFFQMTPANLASIVPVTDMCYLGFGFKDSEEALRLLDGPLGDYMRREIAAKNLYAFPKIWESGMVQISSGTHPIRNPDDLKGFKVRITESRITVDLFKGLGANPAVVSKNELYTALQTKLVDGTASSLSSIDTAHYYEIQKYISITNHSWSGYFIVANGDVWKSLPPDLQAIVERNSNKFGLDVRRDTKVQESSTTDKLVRLGMILNRPDQDPFRKLLTSYYKTWSTAFGSTAWGLLQAGLGRTFV